MFIILFITPAQVYDEFLSKYTVGPQENLLSEPMFHDVIAEYFKRYDQLSLCSL